MPMTITLFGPMRVQVNGQPLPHLHNRKTLWLLALLVLRHGRPVEREWLAGMLWPEANLDRSLGNLRPVLSALRRALGSESERLQSPSRHTLFLDLAGANIDVHTFDVLIVNKTHPALAQAVKLYTGPLLEGCAEEWVPQERRVREEGCLQALQTLAEAALAAGEHQAAADYCRRAVDLDPWREEARRGLMKALDHTGDSNAAQQVYRDFAQLLSKDIQATPDKETKALYDRLRSEAKRRAVDPPNNRTMGTDKAVPVVTGHLPHPLTDLIGREDERLEVAAKLRQSRLVTLTGPGGIGKTRLAVEVAAEADGGFADGVWLVPLEALSDGAQIAGQIAVGLGLKEEPGQTVLEGLIRHLRPKKLLLLLDNCEHLLSDCSTMAVHLLRECAGVQILATSREPLGIPGETVWAVPALTTPEPAHLPAGRATLLRVLMGYESVQLFVERAQAMQKSFGLVAGNALAVAQVCAQLQGIPLAIELAAARVNVLTAAQIAARLNDHLSLLTGSSKVAPVRHQTLRAALDWSYNLLSDPEQTLLSHLSVFAGGWSLDAAETVCAGEGLATVQILDRLASLVDKSLVNFEARDGAADGRYRLLETVRQYAAERLEESGKTAAVRTAHRDFFLALAEEAEPLLMGAAQPALIARLEVEQENLRAALAWCRAEASGAGPGLRLAGALWEFWELRGQYSEGHAFLAEALARPGADGRTLERAKALNAAGVLASYQGDKGAIQALHAEALAIFREVGDLEGAAWSLYDLGNVAAEGVDPGAAQTLYEESLAFFRGIGHKRGIAATLHQVGSLVSKRGDKETARTLYLESLAISREMGNRQGVAWSLNDLGGLTWDQGDYAAARELHEESLAVFRELGHKRGIGWALHHLGKLAREQGDHAAMRAQYEEALAISRELADHQTIAWLLNDLGNVAVQQGDVETARTLYTESLAISNGLADRQGVAWSLHHLAGLAREQSDYATARELHEESLSIFREMTDQQAVAWSLTDLGRVFEAQGDLAAAQAHHAESLSIFRRLGNKQGVVWTLRRQSRVAFDQGDLAAARALYAAGTLAQGELRDWGAVAESLEGLAGTWLIGGEIQKAVRLWGAAAALWEEIGSPLPPSEQKKHGSQMGQARVALGEDAFTAAWEAGRAWTWEQATDFTMEE